MGQMSKTVCVTGAAGHIASWIVFKLLQRGYKVHATVRNPDDESRSGHLKQLDGAAERLTLFKADVLDYEYVESAIRGCEQVIHVACPVSWTPDVLAPAIEGTRNVITACSKVNVKRIVFTSSGGAVILDPNRPADKILDESCWSDIEYCKKAELWYSVAKVESERLAWELARENGIELVSLCPVTVLGPVLSPTVNAVVQFFKSFLTGASYTNEWQRIVDVRDVAEAHILALEDPGASGRYYCFGDVLLSKTILDTVKKNFPQYSFPEKCEGEGEETRGVSPGMASNAKFKGLVKELIPYEKTLVDTVKCLQERGLLS